MAIRKLSDWYAHPEYYEAIFGADTEREIAFLLELNRRFGNGGDTFLEPACGAGRLMEAGVARGLTLIGYDLSEQMLAHARRRLGRQVGRRAHLSRDRMESFCPDRWRGRVDLAFNLVSTFRYLDSEQAALSHLQATRALLKPDGLYALGFHFTDYHRLGFEHERWTGTVGGRQVVCNTREWPPERTLRQARMRNRLRVTGGGEELLIETHWNFRTYDARQARSLFGRAGFAIERCYDFEYRIDDPLSARSDRLDRVFVLRPAGDGG